jgi:hypothetical protein
MGNKKETLVTMKMTNKSEKEKLQPDSIRIITKIWEQDLPGT